jgi:hypothetical protein
MLMQAEQTLKPYEPYVESQMGKRIAQFFRDLSSPGGVSLRIRWNGWCGQLEYYLPFECCQGGTRAVVGSERIMLSPANPSLNDPAVLRFMQACVLPVR